MDLPDFDLAALKVAYHLGFEVLLTDELQDQETEKHDLAWRVYLALRDAMREAYIAGVRIESFNGGVRRTQAKARRTSKADR